MENQAARLLEAGRKLIEPLLARHGFAWQPGGEGAGSGGLFACGRYGRGERQLELHVRLGLGLVTYHLGALALAHGDYMHHVAGGQARYPGFSEEPLDGFRHLAHDLEHFAQDFLSGDGQAFKQAAAEAARRSQLSGFQRLSQ